MPGMLTKLDIGLDRTEIDVLRVTSSRHAEVEIIWHVGSRQSRGCEASASRSDAASPRSMLMWCQMMVDELL
jgi:hypothetical protein